MITKWITDFDIDQIAKSGQCFRLARTDNDKWRLFAKGKVLEIQQLSPSEYLFDCSEKRFQDIWYDYFDLGTDYSEIKRKIRETNDPRLKNRSRTG